MIKKGNKVIQNKKHNKGIKKVWNFFIVIFILFFSLSCSAASLYYSCTNYQLDSSYEKSYDIKFELDLEKKENPNEINTDIKNYDVIEKKINESIDNYYKYLSDRGINVSNIYSEIKKDQHDDYHAFIDINVSNEKDSKDKDIPQAGVYFNVVNASRLSLFYHKGNDTNQNYIYTKDDIVKSSEDISLSSDQTKYDILLKDSWKDIRENFEKSKDYLDQPYIYIIRDQNGLLNRLNYIIWTVKNYQDNGGEMIAPTKIKDDYNNLESSEQNFGKDWLTAHDDTLEIDSTQIMSVDSTTQSELSSGSIFCDNSKNENYINFLEEVTLDKTTNKINHSGNLKYTFLSKYILGIIINSDDDNNNRSYKKQIPEKSPKNPSENANDRWLSIQSFGLTQYNYKLYYREITDYTFAYPIKNICESNETKTQIWSKITGHNEKGMVVENQENYVNVIDLQHKKGLFGSISSILSLLIILLTLILLICIIVSVLYKIPGIIASSAIILSTTLSIMFYVLAGFQISVSLLIGVIILLTLSLFSSIVFLEKYKKNILRYENIMSGVKETIKKSLLQILDFHIITFITGLLIFLLSKSMFTSLGCFMVIGSLLSILFNCFIFILLIFSMFFNKGNNYNFSSSIYSYQKKLTGFKNLLSKNAYTQYFSFTPVLKQNFWSKLNIFKWPLIATLSTILIVAILSLSLFFTLGIHNSYIFFGGTRLVIYSNTNITQEMFNQIVNNIPNASAWYSPFYSDHYIYLFTYNDYYSTDQTEIISFLTGLGYSAQYISFQEISNSVPLLSLKNIIFVLTIVLLIISLLAFVRFGWQTFIVVFVSAFLSSLLSFAVLIVCQIYIDEYICYSLILQFMFNIYLLFLIIGDLSSKYIKKYAKSFKAIVQTYNDEIKCHIKVVLIYLTFMILFNIVNIIIGSSSTTYLFIPLLLAQFVIVIFNFICVPALLAPMFWVKQKYASNVKFLDTKDKNLDKVDEQIIDGINKPIKHEKL